MLREKEIRFSEFREPDINNELTSLAIHGHSELFKNLKLL